MRDGVALTNDEVVRLAFKKKFDAKSARLRAIAEWLLARSQLAVTTLKPACMLTIADARCWNCKTHLACPSASRPCLAGRFPCPWQRNSSFACTCIDAQSTPTPQHICVAAVRAAVEIAVRW